MKEPVKIYTRTGDQGKTSLFSSERVSKDNPFIKALGAVDEANSTIGVVLSLLLPYQLLEKTRHQLILIQHGLFDIGAALATPLHCKNQKKIEKTHFENKAVELLEKWIDEMELELPPLSHFILPGGHKSGAMLHLARAIVRRAESLVIPLYENQEIEKEVLIYLNRLSDYLFVASRFVNAHLNIPEVKWEPHLSSQLFNE